MHHDSWGRGGLVGRGVVVGRGRGDVLEVFSTELPLDLKSGGTF